MKLFTIEKRGNSETYGDLRDGGFPSFGNNFVCRVRVLMSTSKVPDLESIVISNEKTGSAAMGAKKSKRRQKRAKGKRGIGKREFGLF